MNVTLKKNDELNATVKISVEKPDYEQKVEDVLRQQRRNAQIKGFRPGMAPMGLIRKLYGKAVLLEELNKIVSEKLSAFITEEKLEILGDPLPHESDISDFDGKNEFTFSFDLGLSPSFEPSFSKKNKIPYYIIRPDDKIREGYIENYRKRYGEFAEKQLSGNESMLKGRATALDENYTPVPDGIHAEDTSLLLSMISDDAMKNLFTGKTTGDKVTFDIRKTFRNETDLASFLKIKKEKVADIYGNYLFEIESIREFEPAPLNADLYAKVYGGDKNMSDEEFIRKIDEEIEANLIKESDYRFHIDAINYAVEKTTIRLPEEFLIRWLMSVNKELTAEQIDKEFDGFTKDMKWQLIRNKMARNNELKVSEDDLLKEAMTVTRNQLRQYGLYYSTDEHIEGYARELIRKEDEARKLADRILDSKVVELIKESVKLDEKTVSPDEFNKLYE